MLRCGRTGDLETGPPALYLSLLVEEVARLSDTPELEKMIRHLACVATV